MSKVVGEGGIKPLSVAGPPRHRQVPKSPVKLDGASTGAWPAYTNSLLPAPCRKCSGPTWKRDELGAVHPCCELMWTEESGCGACKQSEILNREWRRRHAM